MQRCTCLGVVFVLVVPAAAAAENLLDVFRMALEHDPTFHVSRSQHSARSETLRQAWGAFLPTLEFEYEHIEETQDIVSSDNEVFAAGKTDFPIENQTLTLRQPLFRYQTIAGLSQAKAEVRQSELEFLAAQQDLMLRTAEAYLSVLAAQDNLEFANAEVQAIGRQLELAEARRGTGLSTVTDLHDARARYALAEATQIEAQNLLDDRKQALFEVVGFVPEYLHPLRHDFPLEAPDPPDIQRWVQQARRQNLSVKARIAAVEGARHGIRLQRAGHFPTVDFVARQNNRVTEGTVFGGGSEIETTDLMIRVHVPIFEGLRVLSRTRKARHERDVARRELDLQRIRVARAARSSFLGVMSGIRRVQALEQSVVSSRSALEVRQAGRESGLSTALAVLDAQRELYFTLRDYAQARYDYLFSRLRLKQAAGTLDVIDLESVNAALASTVPRSELETAAVP